MVQDLFLELATDAEQLDFPSCILDAKTGYCHSRPEGPAEEH